MKEPKFTRYDFIIEFSVATTRKDHVKMLQRLQDELKPRVIAFCESMNMSRTDTVASVVEVPEWK